MTSWMKERDRLVEQTLAFVQGVAAQRPIEVVIAKASSPLAPIVTDTDEAASHWTPETDVGSAETDALISLMAVSQTAPPCNEALSAPIADAEALPSVRLVPKTPLAHKPAGPRPIEMALPERDVIAQRVARFRAGQQKLIRDRDNNYTLVQAKIRASLGTDPSTA